jgi:fructose-1,6-bisphosphatase/inositol monophosphatase family enzyme
VMIPHENLMNASYSKATVLARRTYLLRIEEALLEVASFIARADLEQVRVSWSGSHPTSSLDREINEILRKRVPRGSEGWLSEESQDDLRRLGSDRVWVVDPLDGTREFVTT